MRIRKRTPARAADPGPAPALSASPPQRPLPPPQQHPKERSREEEEDDEEVEEKRVILVTGVRVQQQEDDDRVAAAAASNDSSGAMDDVTKPEPRDAAAAARCSRNDGKRWRCKSAAVPGHLFCDRHIAWSTRKRKPRARKHTKHGGGPTAPMDDVAAAAEEDTPPQPWRDGDGDGDDDGYLGGGFQKRAKGGGPGPAA